MTCTLTGLTQPVCLTIIYNLSSRILVDSFISCVDRENKCEPSVELNPSNRNLTIRIPLTLEGQVTFGDNPFNSGCVTTGVRLNETE